MASFKGSKTVADGHTEVDERRRSGFEKIWPHTNEYRTIFGRVRVRSSRLALWGMGGERQEYIR
jgi:hypothetical protein